MLAVLSHVEQKNLSQTLKNHCITLKFACERACVYNTRAGVCVRRARSYGLGTRVARGVHCARLYAPLDARLLHFRRPTSRNDPSVCKGLYD